MADTERSLLEQIADAIVGLSFDDAQRVAVETGWRLRKTRVDGRACVVTRDFRSDRVNVAVENNIVSEVISIG